MEGEEPEPFGIRIDYFVCDEHAQLIPDHQFCKAHYPSRYARTMDTYKVLAKYTGTFSCLVRLGDKPRCLKQATWQRSIIVPLTTAPLSIILEE